MTVKTILPITIGLYGFVRIVDITEIVLSFKLHISGTQYIELQIQ